MAASEETFIPFPEFKFAVDEIAEGTVSKILPPDLQERMAVLLQSGLTSFALTIPLYAKVLHFAQEMSEKRVMRHLAAVYSHLFHWMEQLQRIPAGAIRAQRVHELVDFAMEKSEQVAPHNISCRKGCSFCCHTLVAASASEGDLIQLYVRDNGITVDTDRLSLQAHVKDPENYARSLRWQDSACVFLNEQGECKIYPVRPVTCRKLTVLSDPKLCDPLESNKPDYLVHLEAEIIASALYNIELSDEDEPPSLPQILRQGSSIRK